MFVDRFDKSGRAGNFFLSFFCLGTVVFNHSLFRFGAMSRLWPVLLLLTIAAIAILVPQFKVTSEGPKHQLLTFANMAIGLAILAPLIFGLVLGWNREFPFSGDSYFHVGQSYRMAFWWLSPIGTSPLKVPMLDDVRTLIAKPIALLGSRVFVLILVSAITVVLYRRWRAAALCVCAIALTAWGLFETSIFLRYPGGGYFLGMPFLGPAFAFKNLELGGRLSGFCAAAAWLFALRPWLIGRWPDLRILPAAALLFWHKDVIYYFDSVYLEPWALIFVLLAVEILIVRGREGAPVACLLTGLGACVKEPFILALPLVWLAGEPWRGPFSERTRLTAAAVAAGVPFVLYYAARQSVDLEDMGVNRGVEFVTPGEGWAAYLAEVFHQVNLAFPNVSAFLAIAALVLIPIALWQCRRERIVLACLLVAGFGIAVFFTFDRSSQNWPGYFRFLLYSLPFLAAGVIALGYALQPQWALVAGLAVLILQAPSAFTAIARAAGAPTDRNFVEHYDSPIVFPTKSLIAEAEQAGFLARGAPIQANMVDSSLRPLPGGNINYGPLGQLFCECQDTHRNVLALFVRFTNMSAPLRDKPMDPASRIGIWQRTNVQRDACLAKLRQTCGHVLQRIEGGELVAALGTAR